MALAIVLLLLLPLPGQAEEPVEVPIYEFPEIAPRYALWGGLWLADSEGSRRAGEYLFLENSVSLGGSLIAFPFPHRVHLELELENRKDYFTDLRYAYKDLVLFRAVSRGLWHNLENIRLVGTDVDVQDGAAQYGIMAVLGAARLRFKAPEFPQHIFLQGTWVDREGSRQQRFMGGTAYWYGEGSKKRVSQPRSINWQDQDIAVGANSHLGPVELEVLLSRWSFDPGEGAIMSALYNAVWGKRSEGVYPHNVIPELEGSSNTVKIHTSYTGRLVASLTLQKADRDNTTSGAEADDFLASASVRFMPHTRVSIALRYRHIQRDRENPQSLPDDYLGFDDFSAVSGIRNSISSRIDYLLLSARWRAARGVLLGLDASYRHTERSHAEEWELEDSSTERTVGAYARLRPAEGLQLRLKYQYMDTQEPAYNIRPDSAHKAALSVNYSPLQWLSAFASYAATWQDREHIHIETTSPPSGGEPQDREAFREQFACYVSLLPREDLDFSLGFSYWHNKVKQDIAYLDAYPTAILDEDVPYTDQARTYTASVGYRPLERLSIAAEASYTRAEAGFSATRDIDSYSEMKISETLLGLSATYRLPRATELSLSYQYRDFEDRLENPENPEVSDGIAQSILLRFTRRW